MLELISRQVWMVNFSGALLSSSGHQENEPKDQPSITIPNQALLRKNDLLDVTDAYQSDDRALGRELCCTEQRPDKPIDEFVFWVCAAVIVRNLLPLTKTG